jgi:S1-C subfamily serine protease
MKRLLKTLFFGSCAFSGAIAGSYLLNRSEAVNAQSTRPAPPPAGTAALTPTQLGERFEAVIRQMAPSVVSVEAVKPPAPGKTKPTEESGSGVIIRIDDAPGIVVITNNHVINGAKADQITVHLADDKILRPSRVWTDPESDIAALKVDAEGLVPAPLADSDRAREGNWVLAFGSPFGLNRTVTHGIISARDRGQVSLGSTIRIKDFLQTDAAINPGSSGGPLVNLNGEVVGINTAIASHSGSNSGVAFAIPINLVKQVVRQLAEKGTISRGYLGVHLATALEPADALRLGLDKARGALVESVYPETPAAIAGVKANDVVLQVDSVAIRNENHLINLIAGLSPGQRIRLHIWREKKTETIEAIVGDWNVAQAKLRAER